jgi:hypothetical protein
MTIVKPHRSFHLSSFSLVLISAVIASTACSKNKSDGPPNPDISATDDGQSSDALGRAIHAALQANDTNALLKLTPPPSLAKCERKSAASFLDRWKQKHNGAIQTVGAISDIEKVPSGTQHKTTKCTVQKNVTFGQILVYLDKDPPEKVKTTLFSPFWIVKEGDDPSPKSGWYLADPLAY